MPLYNKSLDAKEVQEQVKLHKDYWKDQKTLDRLQLDMILMEQALTAPQNKDGTLTPKKFQSGIPTVIWRENAALFSGIPAAVCNMPEDDPDLLDLANQVIEPWVAGAIQRSQHAEPVFSRLAPDLIAIGRAWDFCVPKPGEWSNDEVKKWAKALQEETDEDKRKELKRDIAAYRRDHWPYTYRYVDPRSCWFIPGGDIRLPLVVEDRKMKASEIRREYGEDAIKGDHKDDEELEVHPYANHFECGILIQGKEPSIVKQYEHGLEMNPYGLMEAKLLIQGDKNLRWGGVLYPAISLMPQLDQLLTDYMTYVHNYTYSPIGVFFDREEYEEDAKVGGRPKAMELKAGETHTFWKGEDVRPLFNPQMNDQQYIILQQLNQLVERNHISAVERGEIKSNVSNNMYVSATQSIQRKAEPYITAIENHYVSLAVRHLRGVTALNRDYPDNPDPVYVMNSLGGKKSHIGMTPKQTMGVESGLQGVMARTGLVDMNVETIVAKALVDLGVSREQVLEDRLGYANPKRVIERGEDEQIRQSLFDIRKTSVINLAGERFATLTPEEEAQMAEMEATATPEVTAVADSVFGGTELQGRANEGRTGGYQQPQI